MIKIIMKSVDVLDSKIEEVRNGNNPCSNAKYDKTNGLMSGSKITNGYEVKEDRDTLKNVCGSKRLSTDFSRDEATAVKKNKDGGPKPFNSGKTEGGSASSVNRPNDSTSSCSGNGNLSGRLDSNHATGVSTKSIPSKNKCENSMDSTERFQVVDESFAASKMARDGSGKKTEDLSIENPSAKKVDGKCSSMTVGNSKEVSKLNGGHYSKRVSDCILKKDEELLDKTKSQSVEVQLPNEKISTNKISNELEKSDAVAVSTVGTVENREKDVGKSNNIGELKLEVPVKKSTSSDEIKQNDKSISKPHVADSKNECGRQKLREETKIDEFGKKTPMLILKPDKQKGTDRKESQGHGKIISQGASPVTSKESVLESKIVTGKEQNKPKETEVQKRQVSENNKFSCSSKSSSESILKSVGEVTINGKRDKLEGKDAKTTQQPDITSKGDSRGSENLNNKVSVNEKQGQEKEDKKTQEVENKNFSKSKLKPIGQSHLKDGATLTEKQDKPGGKVMKDSSVSEKKASSKSELNRTSDSNHKNDVTVTEKQDKAGEIQEEGKITQVLEKKTSLKSELKPTGESNLKNGVTVTKKHDKPREKEDKDKQDMKNDFSSKCELETTGESSKNDTKFINKQNKAKEKEVENKQELENKTSNVAGGSNLKHDGMLTEKQDEYNENGVKIIQEFGEAASSKCEQKLTDDSNLKNDMKVTEKQSELKEKDLVSTQQFEKTICTDDSKSDVDASLKHDVLADSKSIRPQSETGEKESRKNSLAALSCDNVKKCEKSILKIFSSDKFISDTKKDQGKLEEKKIKVSERNTSSISSNQLITKTIEKSIMTPDVDEIVSATKKEECKPNESGEKIKQKSVENIPRNETSNNIEDVSTKSGVNSVVKSTSLEDTLDEQVTDAPNQDSKIEDEGESNKMESKDIDGSSSKEGDDELVDGTEKIQEQSSDGSSDPVVTNDDSEVTFVEETVTKNFDPMDVDTVGVSDDSEIESLNLELSSENAEEAEESNVIEDVELAAKGDIKSNQDGDLVTADTYNVSEARDTIQRVDESSGRSDIQAVSSPIADFQIGQKRPAKYDEDNVKRLKTDENLSPVEDDCSKKRISSSLDDNVCVSEQKRKRTESGHEDKDSNGDSKSNVKSDSSIKSENSTKLNIENSSNASEDKTKSSVKSSLEFESVSESSEPLIRTSSASVCKNSIKNELLNVDSDISNRSDSGSNTSFQRDNTERERASLKSEVSTNTALLKESLKRMKKSDLEKLVMMKMAESLCYKSEIGDLRMKYQAAKESIDRWRRRCNYYEKVKTELSMTMNKYLKEVEACKNSEKGIEYAIPMKFTRSVGLQVAAPLLNQKRHHDNRGGPLQKSKQLQELLQQQTYKQQQQNKEQQQEKDQQEKEQFLKEQLQKDKESSQISKSAVPKVTTNVRSSTPRRMVSSKPTQTAPSTQVVARAPTSPTIFQKSPQRSAAAATTSSSPSVTSAPATASGPGPVPVAITASKVAASLSTPSSSSSLEVIDLTDKDERSRGLQGTQKPPASYQLVRLPSGKSTITSIPIGAAVVTAAGRNNTVALPPNTVFVKNLQNPTENIVVRSNSVIQRPIQTVKVTQCATHPAPLPPCPPAIHQSGWLLAPPRPQLVVRKTPNGAGIMLSWTLGLNKTYEEIASYQLYAYQEGTAPPNSSLWKKVGDVKALPLPMACTLTQFVEGHKYHFAVRAVDVHSRVGHFSGPSTITLN